jgi:hypothetical protein
VWYSCSCELNLPVEHQLFESFPFRSFWYIKHFFSIPNKRTFIFNIMCLFYQISPTCFGV